MVATVTLADLANKAHSVNSVGEAIGGEVVRDRWNQVAVVEVSDAGGATFMNKTKHNRWTRGGKGKLGNFDGGPLGPNYVIPV